MPDQQRTAVLFELGRSFVLAGVAGCADSIAFLTLHGFFASFMSGNSTRLAIGLAQLNRHDIALAATLIGLFVLGVTAGTLVGPPRRVLVMVAGLMLSAAILATLPPGVVPVALPILLVTPALGAMNTAVQRAGQISITVTYITGSLVRLGQELGRALRGGARWAWVPYALLWASLLGGAVVGALLFGRFAGVALWLPAVVTTAMAVSWPAGASATR